MSSNTRGLQSFDACGPLLPVVRTKTVFRHCSVCPGMQSHRGWEWLRWTSPQKRSKWRGRESQAQSWLVTWGASYAAELWTQALSLINGEPVAHCRDWAVRRVIGFWKLFSENKTLFLCAVSKGFGGFPFGLIAMELICLSKKSQGSRSGPQRAGVLRIWLWPPAANDKQAGYLWPRHWRLFLSQSHNK